MADVSYAESLTHRGLERPEERAALSDRLLDAKDALISAANLFANSLVNHLEGRRDSVVGGEEVALSDAIDEFDEARRLTVQLLLDTGSTHRDIFGGETA